jgi:hypothetical protein
MYQPSFVRFDYADPFTAANVRLRRTSDNVALAGASIGSANIPVVDGHRHVDLATHALTPDSYPALSNVELVATVAVSLGTVSSAEVASAPFTFQLSPPENVVAE